jgi:hypothetical protein
MNAAGSHIFCTIITVHFLQLRDGKSPPKQALNAKLARRKVRYSFQLEFHCMSSTGLHAFATSFHIYTSMAYPTKNLLKYSSQSPQNSSASFVIDLFHSFHSFAQNYTVTLTQMSAFFSIKFSAAEIQFNLSYSNTPS